MRGGLDGPPRRLLALRLSENLHVLWPAQCPSPYLLAVVDVVRTIATELPLRSGYGQDRFLETCLILPR